MGGGRGYDRAEQGMDDSRLPWPDGADQGASGKSRRHLRAVGRGGRLAPDRALQGVSANRGYEIVAVYGTTIKELIHEEFGDGIMSAIDFSLDISREADPKGDRVRVVMSGKFLPYKTF
jgi:cyanate lyase